jgi:plastocyanin
VTALRTRASIAVLAVSTLLSVTACGGGDSQSEDQGNSSQSSGSAETAGQTVSKVSMSDALKFSPATVTATQGATITVANTGALKHDLKLRQGGKEVGGTELVDGGKSATFKVTVKPGSYEMFCSVAGHEQGGMKGTFTVQ